MPRGQARRGLSRTELIALLVGVPLAVVGIILAKPLVTEILNRILNLNPTMVYVVVALLVFAEAAIFFGFIFPGETAVILGGVVASSGRVNVVLLGANLCNAQMPDGSLGECPKGQPISINDSPPPPQAAPPVQQVEPGQPINNDPILLPVPRDRHMTPQPALGMAHQINYSGTPLRGRAEGAAP